MGELLDLIYKSYGLIGLLIAAPFVASVYLWKDNIKLRSDTAVQLAELNKLRIADTEKFAISLSAVNDKIVKAQEQRVIDAQSITTKLVDIISEQSAMNRETNLALERVGDFLASNQSHSPHLMEHK